MSSLINLPLVFAQRSILSEANVVPVTIFLVLGASWIVSAIAMAWVKGRETSERNELKRMMIERGMGADEIERVLLAGASNKNQIPNQEKTSPPAKPQAGPMNWPVHSNS